MTYVYILIHSQLIIYYESMTLQLENRNSYQQLWNLKENPKHYMLENYEYQMQQTYIYLHMADDPGLSYFSLLALWVPN